MASENTLLTPTIIAKEALMMLTNNLVMGKLVHREYKNEFKKVGTSITIRKPVKFTVTKTQARLNENVVEYNETMTVATQAHVTWAFSSVELTMTIDDYSRRYIQPAAAELANTVDYDLCGLYNDVFNCVGTPGTTPNAFSFLGNVQRRLDDLAAPNPRVAVLNPAANWAMADGLKGTFAAKPALDMLTKGYLGTVANLDIHMDQNIRRHTTGAFTTGCTPLVDDNPGTNVEEGDVELQTDGWNASTAVLKAGDVFTVDACYAVNPKSRASTGVLKQWVSLDDETSDAGGNVAVRCFTAASEGMRSTGSYKNMNSLPADDAAINMLGTQSTAYAQNLVFHPNAFALVTMPMAMPSNVWGARVTDKQMGLSIRVVKDYDIDADEEIIRMDILFGVSTLYPELASRLPGE